tara:strand:+ start:917 stop:1072 length:156 start_codon:yes stop_codon:yes gene_type:complete
MMIENRQTPEPKLEAANYCLSPGWRLPTNGGACRDRTDDPLLAKQVLSQLS